MTWTMPRPLLQGVAALLALCALGSFAMGIINAPDRSGRFPGERPAGLRGPAVAGAAIEATDATPLSQERIEAAPKPVEKAVNKDEDEGDKESSPDQPTNVIPPSKSTADQGASNVTPPPDTSDQNAPPPEEPPH